MPYLKYLAMLFALAASACATKISPADLALIKKYQDFYQMDSVVYPRGLSQVVIENELSATEGLSPAHDRIDPAKGFFIEKILQSPKTPSYYCEHFAKFNDGIALVKGRLMDANGRFISNPKYPRVLNFKDGRGIFQDYDGKSVIGSITQIRKGDISKVIANPEAVGGNFVIVSIQFKAMAKNEICRCAILSTATDY